MLIFQGVIFLDPQDARQTWTPWRPIVVAVYQMTENPIPMEEIATSVSITSDDHLMEGEGITVYSVYKLFPFQSVYIKYVLTWHWKKISWYTLDFHGHPSKSITMVDFLKLRFPNIKG